MISTRSGTYLPRLTSKARPCFTLFPKLPVERTFRRIYQFLSNLYSPPIRYMHHRSCVWQPSLALARNDANSNFCPVRTIIWELVIEPRIVHLKEYIQPNCPHQIRCVRSDTTVPDGCRDSPGRNHKTYCDSKYDEKYPADPIPAHLDMLDMDIDQSMFEQQEEAGPWPAMGLTSDLPVPALLSIRLPGIAPGYFTVLYVGIFYIRQQSSRVFQLRGRHIVPQQRFFHCRLPRRICPFAMFE